MDNPRCLHLVGKAAGVSTTADILRGVKIDHGSAFQPGKFCGYTVYNTPGLDKMDSENCEAYLINITNSVYDNGGIVAFVHPQERMLVQMKRVIQAISFALGKSFSASCILITTDMAYTDGGDEDDIMSYNNLAEHQQSLEMDLHVRFKKRYGYTTARRTRQIFVDRLTNDLSMIKSVAPRVILTMAAVRRICDNNAMMTRYLCLEVERLEADLKRAAESRGVHERNICELNSAIGPFGLHRANHRNPSETVMLFYDQTKGELMKVKSELQALSVGMRSMEMGSRTQQIMELLY